MIELALTSNKTEQVLLRSLCQLLSIFFLSLALTSGGNSETGAAVVGTGGSTTAIILGVVTGFSDAGESGVVFGPINGLSATTLGKISLAN